ncbi:MAG: autotransporter outer membrane beta-barrel domain-containing protein, partial [Puniceicoccales bacterium]|nr:autotransporter outer membrane beta-barrel domain-containing protein [Puniceicoccales bacterium]
DDYNGLVADVAALQINLSNEAQTREEADYDLQSEIAAFKTAVFGEGSEDPLAGDTLISRFAALEGKVDDGYTGLEAAHKRIAELEEELDRLRGYLDLQIVGGDLQMVGADLQMVGAGLAGAEYANYTGHVASCLAGTVVNAAEVVQNCIDCRLCDVKGNGNDPFLQIFGGYGKRDKISDLGYDCATYGILLGEDFMKQLGDSAFLKLGGAVSFAHNNVKFSGNGAENGKKGEQNILFGNLFGAYEGFGEENLKTDINALIGFGYSRNKVRRTDASNSKFDGKFPSTDFNVSCELVKNFFHLGNAQVGPWMKVTYNHIAQKEYAESGDENNQENSKNLSMSKSRFNYLNTTLGINLEWEFSNAGDECEEQKLSDANNGEPAKQELNDIKDEERRLRLFAKFGWEYQPIRSRSGYAVTFDGSQFEPNFGNGNKHFFVAVCGFRYKLSTHFEISSNVAGRITSDDRYFNVNAGLGYSF